MSVWISALKEYNSKKGMWCMPRKGTAEHAEVMKIMDKMKGSKAKAEPKAEPEAKPEAVKKTRKAKVVQESESESDVPVAKPKARAEPEPKAEPKKAKAPKMIYKGEKFKPVMRTEKEKEERAQKMELEMMAEDFKANSPLKKKK
jgi:hypothetical protein